MFYLAYKTPPAEVTAPLAQMLGWLMWLITLMCILAIIATAGSFAWNRRMGNPSMEGPMGNVATTLIAAVVVGSAAAIAGAILTP